ncbi:N-alpha-acetyltransferase, non-catalitic subunit, partial [Linderina pennispora]
MSNTDDAATATEHLAQLSLSSSSPPIVHDEYGTEWLDITQLMQSTTAELARGELIRPQTLTLFDAMTSIEVMDPRLDMGMLTEQDEEEISKWDMERVLTMRETLWIIETMFQCEMTWQASASLLQTIYMCQYFSQDDMPETAGKEETKNPCRDLVLYPYLIALGRCCRLVWAEYMRENMYSEEDVYFGSYVSKFFDEFSLTDVIALMGKATAFLDGWLADSGANADEDERKAAQQIQDHLVLRDSWLSTLIHTSVDYLLEDPSALRKSGEELAELQSLHTSMQQASTTQSVAVEVPGVFDKKCMRNYPTMAPIKPKPLKTLAESHSFFSSMISELGLVQQLMDVDNVESLLHLALQFAQRTPTASPLVRSLVASLFVCENRILLRQPIIAFTERAIRECTGPYIWN